MHLFLRLILCVSVFMLCLVGFVKRVSLGKDLQQTIVNTAGIVAGQTYRTKPYLLGNSFSVGALGVAQVLVGLKWLYLRYLNKQKERTASGEIDDKQKLTTGDRELDFKYHL